MRERVEDVNELRVAQRTLMMLFDVPLIQLRTETQ